MNDTQKTYTVVGATSVIAISAIVGYALFATPDKHNVTIVATQRSTTSASQPFSGTATTSTVPATVTYKDGIYTARASYEVPDGENILIAKMTVAGGRITAISPENKYRGGESAFYIDQFDSNITGAVVGRSLDALHVGRVGGASLTSSAFNAELDTIRNEAKS